MKIFLLALLLPLFAAATPYSFYADLTSPPQAMTVNYPSQPQLELTLISGPMGVVNIINNSANPIEANCNAERYPSPGQKGSFVVMAYSTITPPYTGLYQYPSGYKCWFRSLTGTISNGSFQAIGWGK